jgi:hypothetical protein
VKDLIKNLFILIILLGLIYGGYFSVIFLEKDELGIVKNLTNKEIIKVFNKEKNFIWQGSAKTFYSVYKIPLKDVVNFDIVINIPGLEIIGDSVYSIKAAVTLTYELDRVAFFDYKSLNQHSEKLHLILKKYALKSFEKEILKFLKPAYNNKALKDNITSIMENIIEDISVKFKIIGINLKTFTLNGDIIVPDKFLVYEGFVFAKELRKIEIENKKKINILESNIKRDKIIDEKFYDKLKRVSDIIKLNPDILKYIYIDKLSDNIKLIITPDGIPNDIINYSKDQGKEINNLK